MFPPTPPVRTIVWPEGDEPPDADENTDRYAEHATRQAAEHTARAFPFLGASQEGVKRVSPKG